MLAASSVTSQHYWKSCIELLFFVSYLRTWREDPFSVPEEELAMWAIISPNNMLIQPAQERYMDLFTRVFGITREQLTNGPLPDVKLEVQ